MKRIKLISGLLAGALMLSSVVVPAKVQAKNVDLESGLVASYSFDDSSLSSSTGAAATAVVTGLGAYEGSLTYENDRSNGKAVRLGRRLSAMRNTTYAAARSHKITGILVSSTWPFPP